MDFDYSPKTKDLQARLQRFMDEHIYPSEAAYHAEIVANSNAGKRWTPLQTIEKLKPKAQAAGLCIATDVDARVGQAAHVADVAGLRRRRVRPVEVQGAAADDEALDARDGG